MRLILGSFLGRVYTFLCALVNPNLGQTYFPMLASFLASSYLTHLGAT